MRRLIPRCVACLLIPVLGLDPSFSYAATPMSTIPFPAGASLFTSQAFANVLRHAEFPLLRKPVVEQFQQETALLRRGISHGQLEREAAIKKASRMAADRLGHAVDAHVIGTYRTLGFGSSDLCVLLEMPPSVLSSTIDFANVWDMFFDALNDEFKAIGLGVVTDSENWKAYWVDPIHEPGERHEIYMYPQPFLAHHKTFETIRELVFHPDPIYLGVDASYLEVEFYFGDLMVWDTMRRLLVRTRDSFYRGSLYDTFVYMRNMRSDVLRLQVEQTQKQILIDRMWGRLTQPLKDVYPPPAATMASA